MSCENKAKESILFQIENFFVLKLNLYKYHAIKVLINVIGGVNELKRHVPIVSGQGG